jgi:hypothetical protein
MDIGQAIQALREGNLVIRRAWRPHLNMLFLRDGRIRYANMFASVRGEWLPKQADLLAQDWEVVK